ncbi:hypothetical protein Tco_0450368 [Tanacetum coccineum]
MICKGTDRQRGCLMLTGEVMGSDFIRTRVQGSRVGEKDDVEPSVILGISFMRLAKGVAYFGNGVITIYLEPDPFLDDSKETEKFKDDWDHLLNIDFGDVQEINNTEASQEALAIDICKIFSLLKEERPVIETMAYNDKYKKILDGIIMDKFKLDVEIKKEEEEAIKQVK